MSLFLPHLHFLLPTAVDLACLGFPETLAFIFVGSLNFLFNLSIHSYGFSSSTCLKSSAKVLVNSIFIFI